jgi:hypothetical protein
MMKKLLVMIVVLAVANLASAATIWPVADTVGGTQGGSIVSTPGSTVKVYLAAAGGGNVLGGIVDMDLMVTAAGGTITGAINAGSIFPPVAYGAWEVIAGAAYIGGWDFPLNPVGLGTPSVEVGAGTVQNVIYDTTFPLFGPSAVVYTPVGYVDVLYPGGTVTVSLANATGLGGTTTHTIGAPITITPEPVTIGLLGLGGLALLRRRRA